MSYETQTTPKKMQNLKMIPCKLCGTAMPELRLTKYGYDFCVKCSESGNKVERKSGIPVMMGEGDHTWIETVIMTPEQYNQYQRQEEAIKKMDKTNKAEMLNAHDERNLVGPMVIKDEDGK